MEKSDREKLVEELKQQFIHEGCCPVCNQKKRPAYTDERKANMSKVMKNTPRRRVSPTTTKILVAIKKADKEFIIDQIAERTSTSRNTVREVVRRLVGIGELVGTAGDGENRLKTSTFGTAAFWKDLEKEGNIALKSLPKASKD